MYNVTGLEHDSLLCWFFLVAQVIKQKKRRKTVKMKKKRANEGGDLC